MFSESIKKCGQNARQKADLLKTAPGKYFLLSVLAGFFIGIAVFTTYSITAPLFFAGFPAVRLVTGLIFPVGLMLVVFAGAELFTGNVLFITVGLYSRTVKIKESLKVLAVSYAGNLAGALAFSGLILGAGLNKGQTAAYILSAAVEKGQLAVNEITVRGVLCNIMVCLALWAGSRAKEEVMKYIIITMCLVAFITSAFIHSVADMTHLTLALAAPGNDIFAFSDYAYILLLATFGNIIGGIMVGVVYSYIDKRG